MTNRSGKLTNVFVGEGHFDLHLRIAELIQLQEKLNIGPFKLAERLTSGEWFVQEIKETIRLALIGGGLTQKDAYNLTERSVVPGYLQEYAVIAQQTILAAIVGVDDEQIEEEASDPEGEAITQRIDPLGAILPSGRRGWILTNSGRRNVPLPILLDNEGLAYGQRRGRRGIGKSAFA